MTKRSGSARLDQRAVFWAVPIVAGAKGIVVASEDDHVGPHVVGRLHPATRALRTVVRELSFAGVSFERDGFNRE